MTSVPRQQLSEKRQCSIFDLPPDSFDSCRLLPCLSSSLPSTSDSSPGKTTENDVLEGLPEEVEQSKKNIAAPRWSCNTCQAEFESLQHQRFHFKSDIHRFNVKLTIAGRSIIKEEEFDELTSNSILQEFDISSISGSDDEAVNEPSCHSVVCRRSRENVGQKLYVCLQSAEKISLWKCSLMNDTESIMYDDKDVYEDDGSVAYLRESDVIEKLKALIREPRDNTHLRVVLLASGGHFAGCIFDGRMVVAHKTVHRYVVRAKAGKKQSSKDATGKAANSAGASLRRYNELALKKEIQELLSAWKSYFDAASCVFIHAPSNNRQLLFSGEKPCFSHQHCFVRNIPLTVRRPTFKEARRVYSQLMQVTYEVDQQEYSSTALEDSPLSTLINDSQGHVEEDLRDNFECSATSEACSTYMKPVEPSTRNESDDESARMSTTLHEASKSGNSHEVLKLLEQGLDPCVKDERGRTPYMMANEKEVRNTFRRFMAANLEKWDWYTAKVPSALTKEMEESQAAKQAEKDAKRKAKSKELKKLRKAREKKAQNALCEAAPTKPKDQGIQAIPLEQGQSQLLSGAQTSEEEVLKRAQAAEREKRAAAAERRIAALATVRSSAATPAAASGTSQPKAGADTELRCSCCGGSLAGLVPFHRYNYKYCSSSCMCVHRQILEDG